MSRTSIAALLKKYQSGNATAAERRIVEQWYALIEEEPRSLSPREWEALEKRLWMKLQNGAFGDQALPEVEATPLWRRVRVIAAASVALLLALGYLLYRDDKNPDRGMAYEKEAGMERVVNTGPAVLPVALEDGSTVLLSPESELQFPTHFEAQKREVHLTGEAFFEISENPDRPFLVNAGQITTRVLGTSFRVKAPQRGSAVEVSVTTGKVSVYENDKAEAVQSSKNSNGVVLTPNHQVKFLTENRLFVTSLVEEPVAVPQATVARQYTFDYNDTPLSQVLSELEETYSIGLDVEKKALGDCPLTANLSEKGLYAQLDLICAAIQGMYEVKGTTILISGKGCD